MWKKFVDWLKALFAPANKDVGQTFDGWIKDTPDSRDQVYGETK